MSNTDFTFNIPTVLTASGAQPQSPAAILAQLLAYVSATVPGYTANLPGVLIEDVSSTEVGGIVLIDNARVEVLNSISPFTANAFLLAQLGQIYIGPGSAPAPPTNTSVFVQFSGTPGFVIAEGFVVSDGTYQYIVQDGGIIASGGESSSLYCLASITGTWAVPSNSVTQLITSVPSTITLTCTNPTTGTPGNANAETEPQYRSRVLQAGQAISQGMTTMLKTALGKVPGVQQRLISVLQRTDGWEVICGGGDPYQTAYAIAASLFDISTLVGSTLAVTNITNANPGVVTTDINHGYADGQIVELNGVVGMTPVNSVPLTVTVIDEKNFSIGISTIPYPAYVSGGVVTPNLRTVTPNIIDYPDIYTVPYVNPPEQTVEMGVSYNTTAPNFVSQAQVAQLAAPALADYVNLITVGQPINLLVASDVFATAVASVLLPSQISVLNFSVSINGVDTSPTAGTQLVPSDPESYFETTSAQITVSQA
jgi:hypothetical protein